MQDNRSQSAFFGVRLHAPPHLAAGHAGQEYCRGTSFAGVPRHFPLAGLLDSPCARTHEPATD